MRSILTFAAISCLLVAPVMAADVDYDVPPEALYDWSGFYVGAHAGWGWGDGKIEDEIYNSVTVEFDLDGLIAGGQLGWNWQVGSLVLGIESDIGFLDADGSDRAGPANDTLYSIDLGFYATATARLGWAWEQLLIYAKGGAVFADLDASLVDTCTTGPCGLGAINAGNDEMETGLAVGGGLEWAFSAAWSAKVEYLFLNFSDVDMTGTVSAGPATGVVDRFDAEADIHTVKIGINYRF